MLDSNDPWNDAVDRGITAKLYGGESQLRLTQEMALGVGGFEYELTVAPQGQPQDYTPRIIPYHPAARIPVELALICWP